VAHHLAQIKYRALVAPIDDPRIAEFVVQLDPITRSPRNRPALSGGLQSSSGNATDIAYNDDPFVHVNMSVWESSTHCAITSTAPSTQRPQGPRQMV